MSGEIDYLFATGPVASAARKTGRVRLLAVTTAKPHLRSGKLKGLAVGTLKRAELLPDLPTLDEAGIKGYDASNWYAIAAPSGTPRSIVMRLHDEIARYFSTPEVQKQMMRHGRGHRAQDAGRDAQDHPGRDREVDEGRDRRAHAADGSIGKDASRTRFTSSWSSADP